MTNTCPDTCFGAPAAPQTLDLSLRLRRFVRTLVRTPAVARERRALRALDTRLLRDIGLTTEDALREAERPVWDAPRHWRD